MRILLTPSDWSSRYFPLVPLAWACRAAGHEVRVAGQPSIIKEIISSGLPVVPLPDSYDDMETAARLYQEGQRNLKGKTPTSLAEFRQLPPEVFRQFSELKFDPHIRAAEAMAGDLVAFVRDWRPDLIVTDPFVLAAPLAARVVHAPLVRCLSGLDVTRLLGFPGTGVSPEMWPQSLRRLYLRYGVKEQDDYAVRTVDLCPASMQVSRVPNRIPARYVPYSAASVMPDWLARSSGRPRVCVSWSVPTSHLPGPRGFAVSKTLSALADLDVEVIVSVKSQSRHREMLGAIPENVRVVEQIPHYLLAQECDVIVHSGGSAITFTAASYGVPQVVIVLFPDQGLTAERLAATGAGISLEEHLANEAFAMELSARTEDFREGLAAFGEKRAPRFEGR